MQRDFLPLTEVNVLLIWCQSHDVMGGQCGQVCAGREGVGWEEGQLSGQGLGTRAWGPHAWCLRTQMPPVLSGGDESTLAGSQDR